MTNIQGAEGVRDATIPVVALTANVGAEERERFMSAGAEGFLGKPVSETELHSLPADPIKPRRTS